MTGALNSNSGEALPSTKQRWRLVAFGFCAIAAVLLGFVAVPPDLGETFIRFGGYYYMFGLFGAFMLYVWRFGRLQWAAGWRPAFGLPVIVVLAGTIFAVWADPFKHKILFDEYVLQGTAFQMHATKEIGAIVRAYDVQGTWLPIDTFLDKRPYFFAFLLSLVHDLMGFRVANVYALNVALVPICLGLVYWLAKALAGRGPSIIAVGLIATLPLFAQQATGAGMELHNLTMLAAATAFAVLYLRAPDELSFSLLVAATILLAQSRYESVMFVAPVAVIILIGWRRVGRVILPWIGIAAPLLLVPYAWHNRVVENTPLLWQLHGQSARFSLEYLSSNVEGAWKFFFHFGTSLANSWYLSLCGSVAAVVMLSRAWRWARSRPRPPTSPTTIATALFGVGVGANFILLMFYYWSRLDDVIASRFALPMCLLLSLLVAVALGWLERGRWPATKIAAAGLGLWLLVSGFHSIADRTYTVQNVVMQELEWEHEQLMQRESSLLFISNKSTIPFILWRIPSVLLRAAQMRGPQIAYHLKEGTFKEVIVAQTLRPTSADGDLGVAPEDELPSGFHLQPIVEKRFGTRWSRLSRLVAIDSLWSDTPAIDDGAAAAGAHVQ